MTARSRGTRAKKKRQRVPRAPLTPIQTHRARVLLDLGLRQADIITALGETHPQNVSAIFRDKFRSVGPHGLEVRVVEYLRSVAKRLGNERGDPMIDYRAITCDSMGWPQPNGPGDRQIDVDVEPGSALDVAIENRE